MPSSLSEAELREQELNAALAACIERVDSGETNIERFIARYPQFKSELIDFFDADQRVDCLASPLRIAALATPTGATAGDETPDSSAPGDEPRPPAFGDYEILEEIGRGGMGVVYKARQRGLNRLVALKMIRSSRLASKSDVQRFRNEAEATALLNHPNIVSVYEVGEVEGQLYFSMKLIDGPDLAKAVACGRWPVGTNKGNHQSAALVAAIAGAVRHAHERGILHRDLKPSNILLDSAGEPHVTDFGLARRLDADSDSTRTTAILGTPGYMAPEQAAAGRRAVTTATDVYGLGGILYAILTGQAPFRGETPLATARLVLDKDPASPLLFNARVDRDLEVICLKCLRKHPLERYQSAEELQTELERWLAGKPIKARPLSPFERLRRWCRRNRVAAALLSAVSLLVLVATIGQAFTIALLWGEKNKTESALEQAQEQRGLAQDRATQMHQQVYAFRVNQAWRHWQSARAAQARDLLALEIPSDGGEDLRGFEWFYLWRLCDGQRESVFTLHGHTEDVYFVAYSPDLARVASCGKDRTIRLWDTGTGKLLTVLRGHSGDVDEIVFSPDSDALASCGDDGTVRLWDLAKFQRHIQLGKFPCEATSVAFAPDGKKLYASDQKGRVYEWHLPSGKPGESFQAFDDGVGQIAVSPDGRLLAASGRHGGAVFDLATKKVRFQPPRDEGSTGVAFAHRIPLFATIRGESVELYDYTQLEPIARRLEGHAKRVEQVAFSPDDRLIATTSRDGTVRLWNSATCTLERVYSGHSGFVWSCAFWRNGRTLATAGSDGTVRIWDCTAPSDRTPIQTSEQLGTTLAFTRDNTRLVAVEGGHIRFWNVATRMPDRSIVTPEGVACLAVSRDGRWLVTNGPEGRNRNQINLWQLPEVKKVGSWPFVSGDFQRLFLSPDGSQLVTAFSKKTQADPFGLIKTVAQWNARTGEPGQVLSTTAGPYAVTPDWQQMAIAVPSQGSGTEDIVLVQLPTGKLQNLAACPEHLRALELSPSGAQLAASLEDGTILLYDVHTGATQASLVGHLRPAESLAFSPDGRTLASTGPDNSIKLWHVATGQFLMTLAELPGSAALQFSPDGRTLATSAPTGPGGKQQYVLWHGAGRGKLMTTHNGTLRYYAPDGTQRWRLDNVVFTVASNGNGAFGAQQDADAAHTFVYCTADGPQWRVPSVSDFTIAPNNDVVMMHNGCLLYYTPNGKQQWQVDNVASYRVTANGVVGVKQNSRAGNGVLYCTSDGPQWGVQNVSSHVFRPNGDFVMLHDGSLRYYTGGDGKERWHVDRVAAYVVAPNGDVFMLQTDRGSGAIPAGATMHVTVCVVTALGSSDSHFADPVHFSSTDARATLPGDYRFTPTDLGRHVFPVVLNTPGSQRVTVSVINDFSPVLTVPITVTSSGDIRSGVRLEQHRALP
jgi:WD40 repeat protein/tRNA A-37 threonylcarbamoyl transferase component Bud32